MRHRISLYAGMILGISVISPLALTGQANDSASFIYRYDETIPLDPEIIRGKLDNGLTYYIRENSKPENRAQIWLVVNAGSILEDEDQLGLAHFTEHMAFNGTKNFAKHEIIDYLESIGMKFGPEVNAYTSFDETVFMLQVPTDSTETLEKGFQILNEWAHNVSFEDEEIEKERGVVIEEWRLGRGADMRMFEEQLPVILKGSRYAERLPIGKKEILDNFDHETLKRFYGDWYRPDLMAVIAVGDFDKYEIRDLVEDQFARIPLKEDRRERKLYPVPDHDETLFAIATDPEATGSSVEVYYKSDPVPEDKISDYRRMLIEQLFTRMLNIRLYELLNQAEPPYINAAVLKSNLVRTKDAYALYAVVREDGIEKGLETVLTEATRVKQHGFTQTELDRTKTWMIRRMEQFYKERDKTESESFTSEYLRNFLESEPIPGITFEYNAVKALVPGITLNEVNDLAGKWLAEKNRVVLVNAPQKDGLEIPDEASLLSVFTSVEEKSIPAYVDAASAEPLMEDLSGHAEITSEKYLEKLGITEWKLSNGVSIIMKPTDFKNDEIQFQAFSPGGSSLVENSMYRSVRAAPDIISLSGVGDFDLNALNKKLSGKVVSVFPYINELTEGLAGNASPKDLETLFQLIYLYMTRPRQDSTAYLSFITRMRGIIENRASSPEAAFYDTLQVTLASHHFRERPWTMALLDEIDPVESYDIYNDRFADAGDFTFVFVGNFSPDTLRPFILEYLGSLPSKGRTESWRDVGIVHPRGIIKKTVHKGLEPKSRVNLTFTGEYDWNRENNYAFSSMADVLRIKLRETMREDMSGTYGTSVSASSSLYPKEEYGISITWGCAPDRVDEMIATVFSVIDSLKTYPVDPVYITKVSETQRRAFETNLEQNQFWLSSLVNYSFRGQDPAMILEYPELIRTLDPEMIRDAAGKYFNTANYVQVVLLPEEEQP